METCPSLRALFCFFWCSTLQRDEQRKGTQGSATYMYVIFAYMCADGKKILDRDSERFYQLLKVDF